MFEELDNNFKKTASKPIQTDIKKMDSVDEDLNANEPREIYEKKFDNNQMSGLLSLFENKLRSRAKQSEEEKSTEEFDTINVTEKSLVVGSSQSNETVSEEQIDSLLNNEQSNIVKITSVQQKHKSRITDSDNKSIDIITERKPYGESVDMVDPNQNIKIYKENNQSQERYDKSHSVVDAHSNLQQINYSGSTGLSNAIGQGSDSQSISDEEIQRHLEAHNLKKQAEADEKKLNSVVEIPDHLKT